MKQLVILLCLAAMLGIISLRAEDHAETVKAEIEVEANHDNTYGYAAVGLRIGREEKTGGYVLLRGLRDVSQGNAEYSGFLGGGVAIPVVKEHLEIIPGISAMFSDSGNRGITPFLNIKGHYGKLSVKALIERAYSTNNGNGFFRLYPLWAGYSLSRRFAAVGVVEAVRTHHKTESEKGGGMSISHYHGSWTVYWLTGVRPAEEENPGRYHSIRFGRSFEF